jgi:fermentation-respiration switch protein FrsA (DUF1100 family)
MVSRVRTPRLFVRLAGVLVGILALLYAAALGYLRINERAFIFLPDDRQVTVPAAIFALNEQRVSYPSSNGVTLTAWIVPAAAAQGSDALLAPTPMADVWLLICHGNLGNIGYGQRPEFYAFMRELGINLLAFDYRGYGESTGHPDEQGFYDDATASYEYLTRVQRIQPVQIVIFGHSLGSAVAIELASRVQAAGLIVDGGFTSVVDRAQEIYPLFPIRLVASQHFASLDRIGSIRMPKLFLHSPEDTVIPFAHGQRLHEAASPPKRLVSVRGGHDNAYRVDRATYYGAIDEFIRQVTVDRSR